MVDNASYLGGSMTNAFCFGCSRIPFSIIISFAAFFVSSFCSILRQFCSILEFWTSRRESLLTFWLVCFHSNWKDIWKIQSTSVTRRLSKDFGGNPRSNSLLTCAERARIDMPFFKCPLVYLPPLLLKACCQHTSHDLSCNV